MSNIGFRKALIGVISALVLLSLLITTLVSNQILHKTSSDDLKRTLLNSATYESFRIAGHVEKSANTVEGLAQLYKTYGQKVALEDLVKISAVAGTVHKATAGFEDGRSYSSKPDQYFPGGIGDINKYDPRTRSWFKQGRASSGLELSDVFFTKAGEPMLGAIYPIEKGTVLVDVRLFHLHDLLEEMKVVEGATGIITDGSGVVLASTAEFAAVRDELKSASAISSIASTVFSEEYTFNEMDIDGKDIALVSKKVNLVAGQHWYLLIVVDTDIAFAEVNAAAFKLKSLTLGIAILSIVVLLFVLNKLYQPVLKLKETVHKLADGEGDLTSRLDVKSHDDLGEIAQGINTFIKNLQSMMIDVQTMTSELSGGVEVLRSQEKQSTTILEQHLSETDQVVTAMEQLSTSAVLVSENAQNTVDYLKEADTVADTSKETIINAQQSLQTLVDEVRQATENVTTLSKETQDIASILSVIGGIADQTNLLALNAAIEAARAGEQGRGFAVVADEVRALAGKTQQSTSEIESALSLLKEGSSSVVIAIERTGNTSESAVVEAEAVADNLSNLTTYVTQINELSVQISSSADEQNTVIQEITRNMSRIHQMVDELSARGQSMRDETENIETINTQLVKIVDTFKLQ